MHFSVVVFVSIYVQLDSFLYPEEAATEDKAVLNNDKD